MIRVLAYVVLVFLLAAGFAWLAERPGDLFLTWQGYEIRSSIMVAAIGIAIVIAVLALIVAIVRAIIHTPRTVGHFFGARRRDRGYRALSRGMIAVGAGDVRAARRAAEESRSLLGEEPLTLLLTAQAAQIAGDPLAARAAFESLSEQPDTRVLGLHGLFVEARRQGEHAAARHFAEEAAEAAPRIGWAGSALFEYQSRAGDWEAALKTLAVNADARIVDRDRARRLRAVLLTARAMELESGEPDEARNLALEANRLAPDLVPAALVAGRLLSRDGDVRRASRLLETAWKAAPHPDLAEAYGSVRPGDSVRDRLKRARQLGELRANHPEGSLAIARAAIDAHEWQAARTALEGLVRAEPSERVCLLMAEIEEGEHGDQGRVRAWLTRAVHAPRDPAWTADGQVFHRWAPVSPVTGRVDAFEWKVVAGQLRPPRPAEIEGEADILSPAKNLPPPAGTDVDRLADFRPGEHPPLVKDEGPEPTEDAIETAQAAPATGGEKAGPTEKPELKSAPRVPDDPGPEPVAGEAEPRRFRIF
jgi:HemY protein